MRSILALASLATLLGLAACATGTPAPAPMRVADTADRRHAEPCLRLGVPAIEGQAQYLGLLRPASQEYRLERADRPSDRVLCKFRQVNGGIPVQHYEYSVHLSAAGQVLLSSGRYSKEAAKLGSQPRLSVLDVMERAYADTAVPLKTNTPALTPPQLQFVQVTATQFRLIYQLVASHPQTGAIRLTYDADSGERISSQTLSSGAPEATAAPTTP